MKTQLKNRILDTLARYENHLEDSIIQETETAERRKLRAELKRVSRLYNKIAEVE